MLRAILENSATTVIVRLFSASEYSLKRILDRNYNTTCISIQETSATKSKKTKTVICRSILKRRKYKSVDNLRCKCVCSC